MQIRCNVERGLTAGNVKQSNGSGRKGGEG